MLDLMSLEPAPRVTAMAYRIEYLHDGKVIGTEMAVGTLEAAQQIARMGLVICRACLVRIIDVDANAKSGRRTRSPRSVLKTIRIVSHALLARTRVRRCGLQLNSAANQFFVVAARSSAAACSMSSP